MADKNKPEVIEDAQLDDSSGGLPAVQKVREAAGRISTSATSGESANNLKQLSLGATGGD